MGFDIDIELIASNSKTENVDFEENIENISCIQKARTQNKKLTAKMHLKCAFLLKIKHIVGVHEKLNGLQTFLI